MIIENIEPFNSFFYKSCFYNAFFPIIKHFNKSILPFLLNDTLIYKYDDKDNAGIDIDFITEKKIEDVSKLMNLNIVTKEKSDDVLSETRQAISEKTPVILWLDAFYEELIIDTYNKIHLPHNVLVYGYDDDNQVLHVMEHTHKDSLNYDKRMLSYENVMDAYNRFSENLNKRENMPTFVKVNLLDYENEEMIKNLDYHVYLEEFKRSIFDNRSTIYSSLESLDKFRRLFEMFTVDENMLKLYKNNILSKINNIINAKNAERFKLLELFQGENQLVEIMNNIINNWIVIRSVFAKYMYTSIYKQKDFMNSTNRLCEIYKLERSYIEKLLIILN